MTHVFLYAFVAQRKEYPESGDFDRAIMWKKARECKNGDIDEELTPVHAEIVSAYSNFFLKQKNQ